MATWKILLTDGLDEGGKAILRQVGEVADRSGISADDLLKEVGEYDALIVRGRTKVTLAVFEAGKKLKVVGRAGIGVDNIDLNAAQTYGVTVVNSPLATTVSVAELTLSIMLSMIREVPRADASMKAGKWLKKEFEGVELFEKTLGVIGFGRIGTAVAKRCMAFGMNILAFDPNVEPLEARETGAELVALDELLARSDFITLHLPLDRHQQEHAERGGLCQDEGRRAHCGRCPRRDRGRRGPAGGARVGQGGRGRAGCVHRRAARIDAPGGAPAGDRHAARRRADAGSAGPRGAGYRLRSGGGAEGRRAALEGSVI